MATLDCAQQYDTSHSCNVWNDVAYCWRLVLVMEKNARQLDSAPVENEKGKQRGPIFVCQRSFQGSEWMIRGEHKAPIESSKDPEGAFFFFSPLGNKQKGNTGYQLCSDILAIFLPPSTDLTRYSTTRNSSIDGDESDKACRLGLSSPTGNWCFILECDLFSFLSFFFFTRSFYVYCMTGPL